MDANGNRTTYGDDALNRRVTTTDALNAVTTAVFDAADNRIATVDALGHRTSYGYDAANRQVTVTDALGHVASTVFDAAGNAVATVNARGYATTTTFDALNRAVQVQDALGHLATVVYDAAGNRIATIDALGHRTTMAFDALNRPVQVTDALGNLATVVYDAAGNRIATVDQLGRRTTTAYDALHRAYQTTDALGNLATTVFDNVGNVLATVDANGNRTTYGYDALNRQVTQTDALGNVATTAYDNASNVVSRTNARGYTTSYAYDGLNRVIQTTDALSDLCTVVYDAAGNTIATIDGRGNRTTYGYDALNRQVTTTDAMNHVTSTVFDAAGNAVQQIDALGYVTTAVFDALDRRVSVQDPGGGIATTVFDAAGNKVNSIDPMGDKTTYAYDPLNRLVTTTDPLGYTSTLVLDAVGNQLALIDASGNRTTTVFDALNRETEHDLPTGGKVTMAYDAGSRLTSQTDALGRRQDLAYDNDNRVLTDTWRDNTGAVVNLQTHTYDAVGNELTAADQNGAYTYTYDALDRVSSVQEPFGLALTYGYDASGNTTSVQDSKGGTTTSVYDAVNRLTTRAFSTGGANPLRFDQTFTARDQLASVTRYSDLTGTTKVGYASYVYDAAGRTSSIQEQDGSGTVLASYTYGYDLASRVTTQVLDGVTTTIAYNAASEVTNDSTTAYSYDGTGNRTMSGYATGTGNQLTSDPSGYSYTYDAQGNEIKKSLGVSADTWTFGFDTQNHLTSVQERSTDGGTLVLSLQEKYDVSGRRIEEDRWTASTGTVVTRFGYGPDNNVLIDLDGSNNLLMRYVRPDGVDALGARQSAAGTVAWYGTDNQGSVRDILSTSGTVLDRIGYSGFGKVTSESVPANGDRYKYTGAEYQADTQGTLNGARWYDTQTGRWLSTDPSGFAAGDANLYRYVGNSPTNYTDPSGLQEQFLRRGSPPSGTQAAAPTTNPTDPSGRQTPAWMQLYILPNGRKVYAPPGFQVTQQGDTVVYTPPSNWATSGGTLAQTAQKYGVKFGQTYPSRPNPLYNDWLAQQTAGHDVITFTWVKDVPGAAWDGANGAGDTASFGLWRSGRRLVGGLGVDETSAGYNTGVGGVTVGAYLTGNWPLAAYGTASVGEQVAVWSLQNPDSSPLGETPAQVLLVGSHGVQTVAGVYGLSGPAGDIAAWSPKAGYAMAGTGAWLLTAQAENTWKNWPTLDGFSRADAVLPPLAGLGTTFLPATQANFFSRYNQALELRQNWQAWQPVRPTAPPSGGNAPAAASGSRPLLSTQQLNSLAVEEYAGRVLLGAAKKEIGPAVSIAQDTVTGRVSKVYFNDLKGKPPSNLSDPIASRMSTAPEYVKTHGVGSHAEVYAVDELLKARPGAKLSDIQVLTLESAEAKRLLTVKPPCPHCDHLLEGVQYLK